MSFAMACGGAEGGMSFAMACGGAEGGMSFAMACGGADGGMSNDGRVDEAKAEPAATHPAIKAISLIFMIGSDG
jgi:hypothetical protein